MSPCGMSIIIPTYGRVDLLARLIQSILQDTARVKFATEILLADDTPQPEGDSIQELAHQSGARVLYGESHVGGKRNYGAREARYDFVLFLDSDVVIQPGTLQAHFDKLSNSCDARVAGCLGQVDFVGKPTFAWQVISEMQLTLPFSYPQVADTVPWGPTANISFRKDIFLECDGGFDTSMPKYGGEDVDLGLRLNNAGYVIVTAKAAIAEHTVETWNSWRQNFRRLWFFGLADYYLLIRHPDRAFLDFPTGPILWLLQLGCGVMLLLLHGLPMFAWVGGGLVLSILAYHLVYAVVKGQRASRLSVHLLGPLIFYLMDAAKSWEAIRNQKWGLIFRRLKFLDDLIAQDWPEIAASAWGISASALIFFCVVIIGLTF